MDSAQIKQRLWEAGIPQACWSDIEQIGLIRDVGTYTVQHTGLGGILLTRYIGIGQQSRQLSESGFNQGIRLTSEQWRVLKSIADATTPPDLPPAA